MFKRYDIMDKIYKKIHEGAIRIAVAGDGLELYKLSWWHNESKQWPLFPMAVEETRRSQERLRFKMEHRWMILVFIIEGFHTYELDSSEITLEAGELCVIPAHTEYSCSTGPEYYKLVMMIDGLLLDQTCRLLNLDVPFKCTPPQNVDVESMIRTIAGYMDDKKTINAPEIIGLTNKLLSDLALLSAKINMSADLKLFTKIKKRLGSNLEEKLYLSELAAEFNISRSLLHKLFMKHSSTSPQQYRIARKMERAKFCLENTPQSVKEISFQLGYANQHYFSNDFKKHFGSSPRQYRKAHAII